MITFDGYCYLVQLVFSPLIPIEKSGKEATCCVAQRDSNPFHTFDVDMVYSKVYGTTRFK